MHFRGAGKRGAGSGTKFDLRWLYSVCSVIGDRNLAAAPDELVLAGEMIGRPLAPDNDRSPAVEAGAEFIEVGLEVLAAQPMIDAQGPDLEVGEDPADPGQDDVGGHLNDDMGIMGDDGGAGIPGPTVGLWRWHRGRG
jgi:hypothetical protein